MIFFNPSLKVPKCEISDRSDSNDFYTILSSWVGDLVVKILTCYFTQLGVGGNDVLKNMLLTLMEYKFYLRDTTSPRKLEFLRELSRI